MPEAIIDHTGLSVADYPAAKAFFAAALRPLGIAFQREFPKAMTGDFDVGIFGSEGRSLFAIGGGGKATPAFHIAFRGRRLMHSMPRRWRQAAVTTARREQGRTIRRPTTPPSSSTLTATISRPCATRWK